MDSEGFNPVRGKHGGIKLAEGLMMLLAVFLLFLNFGISWFNAWSVGRSWADSKAIGGWVRFVTWCGAVMSACGFTWVYLIVMAVAAGAFGWLPPEYVLGSIELGYLVIILPILGSGLAITIDSWTTAIRRKSVGGYAVAGWNTFAQAHNTYQAAKGIPRALENVASLFKGGGDSKGKAALAMILLVVVALSLGAITTAVIIHKTARNYSRRALRSRGQPEYSGA